MGFWWVGLPVDPAITAFLPVVVNAMFSLTGMDEIISSYAAELVFLLAGANLITIAWERTGVDKRVASMMLSLVGTSVKQQIAVWFLAATLLSAFLPNTVVAAILCSIAMSMLKFVNEGDLKKSRVAPLVLLAIVWGANNGGLMTPLGGAMNLVTVAYIEELTGTEFIYTDWVIQLLPMSIAITVVTLLVLLLTKCEQRTLEGSREYFREMHQAMPPIRREEVLSLAAFIAAAVLTFARELYKQWLPGPQTGLHLPLLRHAHVLPEGREEKECRHLGVRGEKPHVGALLPLRRRHGARRAGEPGAEPRRSSQSSSPGYSSTASSC